MQALKDNYDLWAMDIMSDKQKAEIKVAQEEARMRQAQMAA